MKTITCVSKSKAMKIKAQLPSSYVMKYCNGKYKWSGSAKTYEGNEVTVSDNVQAVWVERRADADGPYARMMCLVSK